MDSPFNPKVDVFMPLYIGRYLQDTADLDSAESGGYLHLLMYQWTTGPLPNDPKKLAQIAKMTPDAWSIATASVMHFMFLGPDGCWHQRNLERIKAEWIDKRQKAHDKAVKAARARWGKYKAKVSEGEANKSDAPSIAQEMPYTVEVQVQKQKNPTPTPPASQVGIKAPTPGRKISTRAIGRSPRQLGRSPLQLGTSPRQLGTSPRKLGISPRQLKQKKGETARNAPRTHREGQVDGIGHKNSSNGVAVAKNKVAPGAQNGSHPKKPDPREVGFQVEVFAYWLGLNPEHPRCPWGEKDWRALRALLMEIPGLSINEFKRLLKNRAASEVSASAHPYKWLRGLLEYSAGPLGPYGKPLRGPRVI